MAGERMPSAVEMENAFGGRGVHATTHDAHRAQLDDDRRGRLMREAQVMDNCTVQIWVPAVFSADKATTGQTTDFISFGRIRFTQKPVPSGGGTEGLLQPGEPDDGTEGEAYDPQLHYRVPCAAVVHKWRRESGLFIAAKLLLFALAQVPEGYRANVGVTFTGPAIRIGV